MLFEEEHAEGTVDVEVEGLVGARDPSSQRWVKNKGGFQAVEQRRGVDTCLEMPSVVASARSKRVVQC